MSQSFLILMMIFLHIVDDYYLQGSLASMKQRRWWEKKAPQSLYRWDYLVALGMHSFSWTFMIMLPISFNLGFAINATFILIFIINVVIHGIVDDLKANRRRINLVIDQVIHLVQILVTATIFFVLT